MISWKGGLNHPKFFKPPLPTLPNSTRDDVSPTPPPLCLPLPKGTHVFTDNFYSLAYICKDACNSFYRKLFKKELVQADYRSIDGPSLGDKQPVDFISRIITLLYKLFVVECSTHFYSDVHKFEIKSEQQRKLFCKHNLWSLGASFILNKS